MVKSARVASILLGGIAICGCQSTGSPREAEPGVEVLSSRNLVGEDCRLQASAKSEFPDQAKREFRIFCGQWENPSGRVYEAASDADSLDSWTKAGWWKEALDQRLQCDKNEQGALLDGAESLFLQCKLRNGGWPYIAIVTRLDGSTYLADGIPAVLPVLEQGIGVISGKREATGAPRGKSSAVLKLEEKLRGRLYGAGDLRTYYRLMTAGQFYNSVKDSPSAANRYREALALHERMLGIENPETLEPMMHLALELSNQKRFAEAQALFERAETMAKQSVDRTDYARYLSYRALHAANQHQFAAALEFAKTSTALRRDLAAQRSVLTVGDMGGAGQGVAVAQRAEVAVLGSIKTPTVVDIVQSLYLEAAMLERLGNLDQAQKTLAEASKILQESDEAPPTWQPELLGLGARIAKARREGEQRERRLNTAATLWDEVAPGERPSGITYLRLGQAYRERGRREDAMIAFRRGIKLVESRGGSLNSDQLSLFFNTAYELAQNQPGQRDALYREMFEAGQLVRGGKTAQDIARAAARLAASEGDAGEIVRELQENQDERYFVYRAYEAEVARGESEGNRERLEKIRNRIAEINKDIEDLSTQVQAALPGYNVLMDAIVESERVTRLVQPGEALVQVFLGDPGSFVFVVKQGQVGAHPIKISEREVARIVKELRAGLEPSPDWKLPPFNVHLANQLYRSLFGSLSKEVEDVQHLITVPTGPLLSLPFGLLVTESPPKISGNDYTGVSWLARRSAISLLPSIRSFVDLREITKNSRAPKAFIGFGNFLPFTEESLAQADASLPRECLLDPSRLRNHRNLLLKLKALPITEPEVQSIANTFPAALTERVLGGRFSETSVREGPLNEYRILYFATHGILPAELECEPEPSLVASLSHPVKKGEDGLLEASEILKLKLDADLVVLSACNTGGPGLETGGESLSGLARAFFFAGGRTLIVSHWSAENKTTAELMVRMFQQLRDVPDMRLSDALRQAQVGIIERSRQLGRPLRSHPLLWGAFTVVGDGAKTIAGI